MAKTLCFDSIGNLEKIASDHLPSPLFIVYQQLNKSLGNHKKQYSKTELDSVSCSFLKIKKEPTVNENRYFVGNLNLNLLKQ